MTTLHNGAISIDIKEIDFGGYLLGFRKSFYTPPNEHLHPGQTLIIAETTQSGVFYTGRMLEAKITYIDKSYHLIENKQQWLIDIEVLRQ